MKNPTDVIYLGEIVGLIDLTVNRIKKLTNRLTIDKPSKPPQQNHTVAVDYIAPSYSTVT